MTKTFKIEGMSCGHCVMAVKKALSRINIESSEVEIGKAKVDYDDKKVTEKDIEKAISGAGYQVVGVN